jgi:transposase
MTLRARDLGPDEERELRRLAHARTEPARLVERAQIVWLAHEGWLVPAIGRELGIADQTARLWLKRFNAAGLAGLADRPRAGRPVTYTPEQIGEVIATSLIKPDTLGLPFGSWTLDRLTAYLNEVKGVPIKRSRIDEILVTEGLRWRTQETWFGERVDPHFAEKRGPSSPSTRRHLRAV